METNELPEDVKRKIEEKYPIDSSKCDSSRMQGDNIQKRRGAEFGYRLGLQSNNEIIEGLKSELEAMKSL